MSAEDRQADDGGEDQCGDDAGGEGQPRILAAALNALLLGAAAALFDEELFPVLHALRGLDEFAMEARLTCDGALAAGCCGGALVEPLGEVLGKLGVPYACCFGHCPLRSHSLLDCPAPIITLVRLHWSPLR